MAILRKQSLVDQIYDQIRGEIINLEVPLGSRLNVSELQERYGVSSTPIREAINRLQKEGLVEYENNVGARVISIEENDVIEIQELAMTLHTAAVRFAMKRGDHQAMAYEIHGEIQAYKEAEDYKVKTVCVHNIVGTFYKYCGNSRLDSNMGVIKGLQLILRNIYGQAAYGDQEKKLPDNSGDFSALEAAVVRGDTEKVIEALENNEKKATPIIVEAVKSQKKKRTGTA